MFRSKNGALSLGQIQRIYPNEWVALAVSATDADGFATAGEVILHSTDERWVWSAIQSRDVDEPIYVYYSRRAVPEAPVHKLDTALAA